MLVFSFLICLCSILTLQSSVRRTNPSHYFCTKRTDLKSRNLGSSTSSTNPQLYQHGHITSQFNLSFITDEQFFICQDSSLNETIQIISAQYLSSIHYVTMSLALGIGTKMSKIWPLSAKKFQPDGSHTFTLGCKYHKDSMAYM